MGGVDDDIIGTVSGTKSCGVYEFLLASWCCRFYRSAAGVFSLG